MAGWAGPRSGGGARSGEGCASFRPEFGNPAPPPTCPSSMATPDDLDSAFFDPTAWSPTAASPAARSVAPPTPGTARHPHASPSPARRDALDLTVASDLPTSSPHSCAHPGLRPLLASCTHSWCPILRSLPSERAPGCAALLPVPYLSHTTFPRRILVAPHFCTAPPSTQYRHTPRGARVPHILPSPCPSLPF